MTLKLTLSKITGTTVVLSNGSFLESRATDYKITDSGVLILEEPQRRAFAPGSWRSVGLALVEVAS